MGAKRKELVGCSSYWKARILAARDTRGAPALALAGFF